MSKAQTNAFLVIAGIFVVGLILADSKNARLRRLGRDLEHDAEDDFVDEVV